MDWHPMILHGYVPDRAIFSTLLEWFILSKVNKQLGETRNDGQITAMLFFPFHSKYYVCMRTVNCRIGSQETKGRHPCLLIM